MATGDLPTPIFVNTLALNGFVNGVLNVAFSQARWYPRDEGGKTIVAIDQPIVVDLRMDLACAQQLQAALVEIIEANTKPKVTS